MVLYGIMMGSMFMGDARGLKTSVYVWISSAGCSWGWTCCVVLMLAGAVVSEHRDRYISAYLVLVLSLSHQGRRVYCLVGGVWYGVCCGGVVWVMSAVLVFVGWFDSMLDIVSTCGGGLIGEVWCSSWHAFMC